MENKQMERKSSGGDVLDTLPGFVSVLAAIFMLCVVPLYFNDGFFDINRAKVSLIITAAPYMAAMMGLTLLIMPEKGRVFAGYPWLLLVPLLLFLIFCVISCARTGFEEAVLTGSEGRYGGLYFVMALVTVFFVIAMGRSSGVPSVTLFLISSTMIALLGCVNALGVDPLRFYVNMRAQQIPTFLSTIGHYDFYGTVLLLPASVAYAISVKGRNILIRFLAFLCAAAITLGAYAARTDSVWIGMAMIGYGLFFLSGEDWHYMSRTLLMIAVMVFCFPVTTYFIKTYTTHNLTFSGLYETTNVATGIEAAVILFLFSFICMICGRHEVPAPGYKRLALIGLILFLVALIILIGLIIFATRTTSDTALLGFAPSLRMDDNFGTRRGYIWIRAVRAFSEYSPIEKAFGRGLELTRRITRPFIENATEEQLSGGVYNDVHCQPLQILLTCGICGMTAFILHFLLVIHALRRNAESDPILTGIATAVFVYFGIMLINVTQPILLTVYFSLTAVGIARISRKRQAAAAAALDSKVGIDA